MITRRRGRLHLRMDEGRLVARTLELLADVSAASLAAMGDDVDGRAPGVYLLGYRGAHRLYRRAVERAIPIYVGSAAELHARLARHVHSIGDIDDLDARDMSVRVVHCDSWSASLYLEGLLVERLRPVWNQRWLAGFGSRAQGPGRVRAQRRSPWDTLHPGRRWATGAIELDRSELARRVVDHLDLAGGPTPARRYHASTADGS